MVGGTRGIGVVIAPSGIERKSFFLLIREARIPGSACSLIKFSPWVKEETTEGRFG